MRAPGCLWRELGGEANGRLRSTLAQKASSGIEQHYAHKRHNQQYKREEKEYGEWKASSKVIIASNGDT